MPAPKPMTGNGAFKTNSEGHLEAYIPGGPYPSVCTLAPGAYVYVVHVVNAQNLPSDTRLGQQGTITVK